MKHLRSTAAIAFLFIASIVTAQQPTLTIGKSLRTSEAGGKIPIFIGHENGNTYMLRIMGVWPNPTFIDYTTKRQKIGGSQLDDDYLYDTDKYFGGTLVIPMFQGWAKAIFQKFDANNNLVYAKQLVSKDDNRLLKIKKVAMIGGKFYKFFTVFTEDDHSTRSFYTIINSGDGSESAPTLLATDSTASARNSKNYNSFSFDLNVDSTILVMRHIEFVQRVINGEEYFIPTTMHVQWFDKTMIKTAESHVKLSIPEARFQVRSTAIDKSGNLFSLCRVVTNPESSELKELNYQYKIMTLTFGSATHVITDVLQSLNANDVLGYINSFNQYTVAGFTGNNNASLPDGYFLSTYNSDGILIKTLSNNFNKADLTAFEKSENKSYSDSVKLRMHLRKVYDINGGHTFVAEKYYISAFSYFKPMSLYPAQYISYTYDDALIFHINDSGEQVWTTGIQKSQHMLNTTFYLSLSHFERNGILYLFYNANKDDPAEPMSNVSDAKTYFTTIEKDGKVTNIAAFESKQDDLNVAARSTYPLSEKKFAVYLLGPTNQALGSVSY